MADIKEICDEALEHSKKEFKTNHGELWKYTVTDETIDHEGQPIERTYNFIKVGDGMLDDVAYMELPHGGIECNYSEPGRFFETVEEAYMFHNKLFELLEETED